MPRLLRHLVLYGLGCSLVINGAWPRTALAASATGRVLTSHALGLSLTLPSGWSVAPYASGPSDARLSVFVPSPVPGGEPAVWMDFYLIGSTPSKDPRQAARQWACGLAHTAPRSLRSRIQERPVQYAGAPGFMVLGLPGQGYILHLVLVHQGAVYDIMTATPAPGAVLRRDQKMILASLRFVSRVGRLRPTWPSGAAITPCS